MVNIEGNLKKTYDQWYRYLYCVFVCLFVKREKLKLVIYIYRERLRLNFLLSTFDLILKRVTRKSVGSNSILYVILYVKIELVVTLSYYQLDFYVQSYVQVYSFFGSNINYYGMLANQNDRMKIWILFMYWSW